MTVNTIPPIFYETDSIQAVLSCIPLIGNKIYTVNCNRVVQAWLKVEQSWDKEEKEICRENSRILKGQVNALNHRLNCIIEKLDSIIDSDEESGESIEKRMSSSIDYPEDVLNFLKYDVTQKKREENSFLLKASIAERNQLLLKFAKWNIFSNGVGLAASIYAYSEGFFGSGSAMILGTYFGVELARKSYYFYKDQKAG